MTFPDNSNFFYSSDSTGTNDSWEDLKLITHSMNVQEVFDFFRINKEKHNNHSEIIKARLIKEEMFLKIFSEKLTGNERNYLADKISNYINSFVMAKDCIITRNILVSSLFFSPGIKSSFINENMEYETFSMCLDYIELLLKEKEEILKLKESPFSIYFWHQEINQLVARNNTATAESICFFYKEALNINKYKKPVEEKVDRIINEFCATPAWDIASVSSKEYIPVSVDLLASDSFSRKVLKEFYEVNNLSSNKRKLFLKAFCHEHDKFKEELKLTLLAENTSEGRSGNYANNTNNSYEKSMIRLHSSAIKEEIEKALSSKK